MSIPSINVVLKFGSSVLRTPASLPIAVTEIYRHYRRGRRVIAVVSAFEGVTDRLLGDVSAGGDAPDPATLAVLLSRVRSPVPLSLPRRCTGQVFPLDTPILATSG